MNRLFHGFVCRTESGRKDRAELDAIGMTGINDSVTAFESNLERFFHNNMLTGFSSRNGWLHVSTAGSADGHNIHSWISQHGINL